MKTFLIILSISFLNYSSLDAQSITGYVRDSRGVALAGVSVILKGSFTATSTGSNGKFNLDESINRDTLFLDFTAIGFEPLELSLSKSDSRKIIQVILIEKVAKLKDVIISAGSFEASDEKKTTILKPFDLATTPAATPDLFKAINELPGTSKVGESEGLFVRGGSATETKAVFDGLLVQDPFYSSVPGIVQNGRFSTLLFKGTSFSTGGYSALYGDALSSVLILNTQDLAQASSQSLVLNTSGISGNVTQKWSSTSLAVNAKYYNLKPSFLINKQNYSYDEAPQGYGGNVVFRKIVKNGGIFKLYASLDKNNVDLKIPYLIVNGKAAGYNLMGENGFINSTFKKTFGNWILNTGISASINKDQIVFDTTHTNKNNERIQGRIVLTKFIGERSKIYMGSEIQNVRFYHSKNFYNYTLNEVIQSTFIESEFYLGNKIAARAGIREESTNKPGQTNLAPRVSMAYIIDPNNQVSASYGDFYQRPQETYLLTHSELNFEKASHYILDYQYTKDSKTFRIEGYYKKYTSLVREVAGIPYQSFDFDRIPSANSLNTGIGYAKGVDVFWYDKKSISNLNYWISYSFLDTKRLYENFLTAATPTYASAHNASVVIKYSVPKTSLNLGFTYNYNSGRPYYNPQHAFLSDRTPANNNLIFSGNYSWFYKSNLFALFLYADNILGFKNIYNYYYSGNSIQHYTLGPPAYRSIYLGINITLAKRRTIMGINF